MKKFLMYVIIVVTCLFLGFTVYYLTQNNENIFITVSREEAIYKNKGESLWLDNILTWTKPYKTTTIAISSADETVVKYDEETKRFDCIGGGFTSITITPSNEYFGPFVFEIYVGDGSIANPYVVDSAADLALIGNDNENEFLLTKSYILVKDIDLKAHNEGVWTPLGKFEGNFNGNGHTIYNLNITSGTDVGLFSEIGNDSLVENVKFSSAKIDGSFDNAGVVAGVNKGTIGKIEVISSKITNTSETGKSGAIVGTNILDKTPAMINMCSVNTEIISNGIAGGLVGANRSSIILNSSVFVNSYESTSSTAMFGGLAGVNSSTLRKETFNGSQEDIYYASAIKTSFVVIEKVTGESPMGAVVCENLEDEYESQMFFNIYNGCIYVYEGSNTMPSVFKGNEIENKDKNLVSKSSTQMLSDAAYEGEKVGTEYTFKFDFTNAWLKNDNKIASVNFEGSYETYKINAIGKEMRASQGVDFLDFLNGIRSNPSAVTATYIIDQSGELDLSQGFSTTQYWQTLAPIQTNPMQASIIVSEGVNFTIKNFKLKDSNSSFFGYLSGNTLIDGITFENVTVESCTDSNSGVVATGLLNGATLQNVTVKNFESIRTTAQNVGIICGHNLGTIKNCNVVNDVEKECIVKLSKKLVNFGSIVGNNEGFVDNCKVSNVRLGVDTSETQSGDINFGGAVGTTKGNISNCKVNSFVCETAATGHVYAGGLVGYTVTSSCKITYCYSYADIALTKTSNGNAFLGGLVGHLASGTSLKYSFYDKNNLQAFQVGAIASNCVEGSTIFSCYAGNCTLTGFNVGGLVTKANGKISDCYTFATLKGTKSSANLCGITQFVGSDCDIRNNFIDVTFTGSADYYAESWSEFRTPKYCRDFNKLAGKITIWGPVVDNIIIHENSSHIQKSSPITGATKGWIDVTRAQCNGTKGNYEVFKEHGFSDTTWKFDKEAGYPTLRDVAVYEG